MYTPLLGRTHSISRPQASRSSIWPHTPTSPRAPGTSPSPTTRPRNPQSAVAEVTSASALAATGAGAGPNLRSLLLAGDFFLGGVVAGTQVKLLLRMAALKEVSGEPSRRQGGWAT